MNKNIFIANFSFFLSITPLFSQDVDLSSSNVIEYKSINENVTDFEALRAILSDVRIVLLGEQTHGDGATFDTKVELIKFLNQEMGFELLAFESGLYDNYKANQLWSNSSDDNIFKESVMSIWSDTRSFDELLAYINQSAGSNHPLEIAGFDLQEEALFKEYYFQEVKNLLEKNHIYIQDSTYELLRESFLGGIEQIFRDKELFERYQLAVQAIEKGFEKIPIKDMHVKILHQTLVSKIAEIEWDIDILNEKESKVQNPRDLQMAKNLIFLSKLYPDKKIIGWGASYHFANKIEKHENTEVTKQYIQQMHEEHEHPGGADFDIDVALDGAIPMGRILKEYFGDQVYSIAFSSYKGTYGMLGREISTIVSPPEGSIEKKLHDQGYFHSFIDLRKMMPQKFYFSAMGNLPVLAPWSEIFDGLIYIENSYPPIPSEYSDIDIRQIAGKENLEIEGRIVDAKTGDGIAYAHVMLENTSKGTVSNGQGYFKLSLGKNDSIARSIIFSSIGYKKQAISVEAKIFDDSFNVVLEQESQILDEVVIQEKALSVKDIIRKAKKNIESNYFQGEYNQEIFYRVQKKTNDSLTFQEEASVYIYDKAGYQPRNNAYNKMYGQILQVKNVKGKTSNDKWDGVGSLWLVFSHDLILDKDNLLHRTSAYVFELTDITKYNGEEVYEISFTCKRPSAYTTGYGYPAPESSHGKVYIKVDNYAILKYEHCVERKPYTSKRTPDFRSENMHIHLMQTYKWNNSHYFIHHSKQVQFRDYVNLKTNETTNFVEGFDMLSSEIKTENVVKLAKPIENIKLGLKIKEDLGFWKTHNIVIEDEKHDFLHCTLRSKEK